MATSKVTEIPAVECDTKHEDVIWDRAMAFWPTVAIRYMVEGGDIKAHLHKTRREFLFSMNEDEKSAMYKIYQSIEGETE